jgi:hypothetical protein
LVEGGGRLGDSFNVEGSSQLRVGVYCVWLSNSRALSQSTSFSGTSVSMLESVALHRVFEMALEDEATTELSEGNAYPETQVFFNVDNHAQHEG